MGLDGKQIIEILALLNKLKPRHLDHFRDAEAFPEDQSVMYRIEHIYRHCRRVSNKLPA